MKNINLRRKSMFVHLLFPLLIFTSTFFMCIGYAAVNSVLFTFSGESTAKAQEDIFITKVNYVARDEALPFENGKANFANGTILNSSVILDNDISSKVSFEVSFYNSYKYDFVFKDIVYDELVDGGYDNVDIKFSFDKQDEVIASNGTLTITVTFEYENFTDETINVLNSILDFKFELLPVEVGSYIWSEFSGTYETFTASENGIYFIELWGARGGNISPYNGGKGAYTAGNISLEKGSKLYVYLGGRGEQETAASNIGGYNGGGYSGYNPGSVNYNGGGGGSTDIRLTKGTWNNFNSLKSRIMVAAGGGGATSGVRGYYTGGSGGGLIGQVGEGVYDGSNQSVETTGATQTSGGDSNYEFNENYGTSDRKGRFGYAVQETTSGFGGGGGSGYYAGATSWGRGGSGGSSFISGHNGCDAITSASTSSSIVHTGQPNHYSGYVFTDTVMVDGNGYQWTSEIGTYTGMPNFAHTSTITGNSGNGYAKIFLVSLFE